MAPQLLRTAESRTSGFRCTSALPVICLHVVGRPGCPNPYASPSHRPAASPAYPVRFAPGKSREGFLARGLIGAAPTGRCDGPVLSRASRFGSSALRSSSDGAGCDMLFLGRFASHHQIKVLGLIPAMNSPHPPRHSEPCWGQPVVHSGPAFGVWGTSFRAALDLIALVFPRCRAEKP